MNSTNATTQKQNKQEFLLSKSLSKILRHGAQKEGLEIRSDGFVKLDDLVNN